MKNQIEIIWNHRINQQTDLALSEFAKLKAEINLLPQDSSLKILSTCTTNMDYISIVALEVSILRLRKKMRESSSLIEEIESKIEPGLLLKSFYYQFEKGLTHFIRNEWTEALESFIYAKNNTTVHLQKVACLGNLLFCTENLGLPNLQILNELQDLIALLPVADSRGIRAQLKAFDIRQAWRRGDIQDLALDKIDFEKNATQLSQADYLSLYIMNLPYFEVSKSTNLARFYNSAGELFNQNFRMQTLIGDRSISSGIIRLTDWVERLYLWTWRWMTNPEAFSLNAITQTLMEIPEENIRQLKTATAEDQMLFKITLGWISVFDPSAQLSLTSLLQYTALEESMTFKLEKLCQHLIKAYINNQESVAQSYKTEILKSKSNLSKYFIKFAENFNARLNNQVPKIVDKGVISIRMSTYEVLNGKTVLILSPTICRAISSLHENEFVRLEDLAYSTFFLKEYDAFLHGTKLSNLLTRINKLLPKELRVTQRDGRVFMQGKKQLVQIQHASQEIQELSADPHWPQFVSKWKHTMNLNDSEDQSLQKNHAQLRIKGEFTRTDFQKEFNVSKSHAQRMLQNWLSSKKIVMVGSGRNIHYKFASIQLQESMIGLPGLHRLA